MFSFNEFKERSSHIHIDDEIKQYTEKLKLNPNDIEALNNIALAYFYKEDPLTAINYMKDAYEQKHELKFMKRILRICIESEQYYLALKLIETADDESLRSLEKIKFFENYFMNLSEWIFTNNKIKKDTANKYLESISSISKIDDAKLLNTVTYLNHITILKSDIYDRVNFENLRKLVNFFIHADLCEIKEQLLFAQKLKNSSDELYGHFLESCIKLGSKHWQIYLNYSNFLSDRGEKLKACRELERYLEGDFNDVCCYNLGCIYQDLGKLNLSIECYKRIPSTSRQYWKALNNIGIILRSKGKEAEAELELNKSLTAANNVEALYNLSLIKKRSLQIDTVSLLNKQLKNNLNDPEKVKVLFALAYEYQRLGDDNRYLHFLSSANKLCLQITGYDIVNDIIMFNNLKNAYPQLKMSAEQHGENKRKLKNIFIVGLPRSGTTLVEQILGQNQKVFMGGEITELAKQYKKYSTSTGISPNSLSVAFENYYRFTEQQAGYSEYFTDKMPLNFRWIGLVKIFLKDALIIHVHRNKWATLWSNYHSNFNGEGNGFGNSIPYLHEYYGLYQDLMKFWHEQLPGEILNVDYDQLTEDPEKITQQIFDYCGLDWNSNVLEFHSNENAVRTASAVQVKQPIYRGSSKNWIKYKDYIESALGEKIPHQ